MPTEVIRLTNGPEDHVVLLRAAEVVREGGLVAFPTETVYGVAARGDRRSAVEALRQAKGRGETKPFTVHVGPPGDVQRYVPNLDGLGRRLMRKGWPGPLTLVFNVPDPRTAAIVQECGPDCADLLYHEGAIGLRCPDHEAATEFLRQAGVPIVAASANRAGQAPPTSAQGVLAELSGVIDLVLDGGVSRYARASTVVRLNGETCEVLREGVYDERTIRRLASLGILLVCTGNTCRSPMAAAICRQQLAERLGCTPAELAERHRIRVTSAGTGAGGGLPASPEAVEAMRRWGLDVSSHLSNGLDRVLIEQADHVWCMTRGHVDSVVGLVSAAADRTTLLDADGDIADPLGGAVDDYLACAERISAAMRRRIREVDL